jgi:hypothetical protein
MENVSTRQSLSSIDIFFYFLLFSSAPARETLSGFNIPVMTDGYGLLLTLLSGGVEYND